MTAGHSDSNHYIIRSTRLDQYLPKDGKTPIRRHREPTHKRLSRSDGLNDKLKTFSQMVKLQRVNPSFTVKLFEKRARGTRSSVFINGLLNLYKSIKRNFHLKLKPRSPIFRPATMESWARSMDILRTFLPLLVA